MDMNFLQKAHEERKEEILQRLQEFEQVGKTAGDEKLFEELSFCVLTANTSASMSLKSIAKIRTKLTTGTHEELAQELTGIYRYPNKRSEYIVYNREYLNEEHGFRLRKLIDSFNDSLKLRDFIAENIKGIGYKEASHFLRNIGFRGLCILDKHILNSLEELGVLEEARRPRNREEYLETERKMKSFCKEIRINMDEMDLLLWGLKTGEILK